MGWTGFTWDKHLFPDPKMFLDWYVPDSQKFLLGLILAINTMALTNVIHSAALDVVYILLISVYYTQV